LINETSESSQASLKPEPRFLEALIKALDKVGVFSRWTNIVGIIVLFLMVCLSFVDVIMRYFFNMPIKGVLEITEVMLIVSVFLAIAHTQNEKAHVTVDLLIANLPRKARLALEFITNLLGLGLFIIIVWRSIYQSFFFIQTNSSHSQNFFLPDAPFAIIIALGCACLGLLILRDILKSIKDVLEYRISWYYSLLIIGIPVLAIIVGLLWIQPSMVQISKPIIGLIGVIFSLILFFMGMPIAFGLILTGFLFIGYIRGMDTALSILGTEIFRTVGSYSWSVLPFFVLMGYFCFYARFGEDLFQAAYRWVGHLRGGMGTATIAACTMFAAIVGDTVSATATMGAVALPQMKRYNYNESLSVGCITAGASLGPIIPPSVVFILYGLITDMSIGDLFMAGLFPGALTAVCFILIIMFWTRLKPNAGPSGAISGWSDRFISMKAGGPVLLLFIVVIGGIYTGIFTPSEGGAIGAMIAFLLALVMKRWTRSGFAHSLLETGKVVSMVFLIIVGGTMFTRFAAWCNLSGVVSDLITSAGLNPITYIIFVLVLLFIAGCFIDLMPLLLIGVPIFHPIAMGMGINPLWFALLVCLTINVGSITPPVGINLFVLKGLHKDIPMSNIYLGSMPFVIGSLIAITIIILVPSIATWLPEALK
jgi:tripartite ATP-independent transporter DctM subunit